MSWGVVPTQRVVASTSAACYTCAAAGLARAARAARARTPAALFVIDIPHGSPSTSTNGRNAARRSLSTSSSMKRSSKWRDQHRETLQHVKPILDKYGIPDRTGRTQTFGGRPASSGLPARDTPPAEPHWKAHRAALKADFPEGWKPPRKVGRSEMAMIRRLHGMNRVEWSLPILAEKFRISPEAVRRILKSGWRNEAEVEEEALGRQLELDAMAAPEEEEEPLLSEDAGLRVLQDEWREQEERELSKLRPARPLRDGFSVDRRSKDYKWAWRQSLPKDSNEDGEQLGPGWRKV